MSSPGEFIAKQLTECGQMFYLNGQPLSLTKLGEIAYEIKRNRESNPERQCSVVDVFTTDGVRDEIGPVVVEMFQKKYGIDPGDYREMLKPSPFGSYLEVSFPAVKLAFFSLGNNNPPALWIFDICDMTKEFALMSPKNHALIIGFKGFIE